MNKNALKVYVSCAAIVYGLALAYCYVTDHFLEMGIVGGVMVGLALFVMNIHRDLN